MSADIIAWALKVAPSVWSMVQPKPQPAPSPCRGKAKEAKETQAKRPRTSITDDYDQENDDNEHLWFRWQIDNEKERLGKLKHDYPLTWQQYKKTDPYLAVRSYRRFIDLQKRVKVEDDDD